MILAQLCTPALIYIIFSVTQIIIDTFKGHYNVAFIKFWISVVFTILLNFLCERGLGIISWFIVFLPFILMTAIVSILLVMFGLDPLTGKKLTSKEVENETVLLKENEENLLKEHKNKRNDLRFSPYYLDLEKKRNKKGVEYSKDLLNQEKADMEDYLIYKKIRNKIIKDKIIEKNGTNSGKKDDKNTEVKNDTAPKPYDPPENLESCKTEKNKPKGCPCDIGSDCLSGNCDSNYDVCIKRNNDINSQDNSPNAPNQIKEQQVEKQEREKNKTICSDMGNKYNWNGVECIYKI
tara:strand:- start:10796 stop:11674 length:879 start_codon:yes stop_codon:yes gene_type:complete